MDKLKYFKESKRVITGVKVIGEPKGCSYQKYDECLIVYSKVLEKNRPVCIKVEVD